MQLHKPFRFISIGSKGTSRPQRLQWIANHPPLIEGRQVLRWRGDTPEAEAGHVAQSWVSAEQEPFTLYYLADALENRAIKIIKNLKWEVRHGDLVTHEGIAFVKADWDESRPKQDQYTAVDSETWPHGCVETPPERSVNRDRIAKIDFSSAEFFYGRIDDDEKTILPQLQSAATFSEGQVNHVSMERMERKTKARKACIEYYGFSCYVCGFNFSEFYGPFGVDYIHVHHEDPLATGERETDPVRDMKPVCPNCHAMIHRTSTPLSVDELKQMIEVARGDSD